MKQKRIVAPVGKLAGSPVGVILKVVSCPLPADSSIVSVGSRRPAIVPLPSPLSMFSERVHQNMLYHVHDTDM